MNNDRGWTRKQMTDKKEQARKLREAAMILDDNSAAGYTGKGLRVLADELDPPAHERWERVRDAGNNHRRPSINNTFDRGYFLAILAEADKGMMSKDELRKKAPWWRGESGSGFYVSSYNDGIAALLRVMDSL